MAKCVHLYLAESDRLEGKPAYEVVVEACRQQRIAGATVFRGIEGYGETGALHRAHWVGRDQPIIIVIVDEAEAVARLLPVLEALETGTITVSEVEARRVCRTVS